MYDHPQQLDPDNLQQVWDIMDAEKGDLVARTEEYARWTLPYICPINGTTDTTPEKAEVSIGARLVNHLSNRIVDTMFPHDRPFFAIPPTPEILAEVRKDQGDEVAHQIMHAAKKVTAVVEEAAMRKIGVAKYRPQAVLAVKHLIISGNALIRRHEDNSRTVYGIKDHCIRRDVTGNPYHQLMRDMKRLGSLTEAQQAKVREIHPEYKDDHECTLYTEFVKRGKRWEMRQAVDDVLLVDKQFFKPVDLPTISLTWNLSRGANYATGHVEDHGTAFHQIDVLTLALLDMVDVLADVKFLVDPSSTLDVDELNRSRRGSYHQGREGDISTPQTGKTLAIGEVREIIAALERELSQAFLLNSGVVRDAERVTAEEIRFLAMELESAFGGLYSRLAREWQQREAEYAVSLVDFKVDVPGNDIPEFEIVVVTGLESLSREGQLENLRRAIADLAALDAIPEEIRARINPEKFASFVFGNHAVKFEEFLYSKDEFAANQQAELQQQKDLLNAQANAKVQEEAGKQAVQES